MLALKIDLSLTFAEILSVFYILFRNLGVLPSACGFLAMTFAFSKMFAVVLWIVVRILDQSHNSCRS